MKLISRKAITATVAAAAISTASLTAPAMAQDAKVDAPVVEKPADTAPAEEKPTDKAPAEEKPADKGSSTDFGSSDMDIFTKEKDGKTVEMTTGEKIREIVSILTGIGALFGAIITINNNIDRIIKGFKL